MRFVLVILLLLIASCSSNKAIDYTSYIAPASTPKVFNEIQIQVQGSTIPFHGYPNFDKQDPSGGMLYPAATPEMFLVAIFAHAAAEGTVESSKMGKIQADADKILAPYKRALQNMTNARFVDEAVTRLNKQFNPLVFKSYDTDSQGDNWILSVHPIVYLLHDERTLMIRDIVKLTNSADPKRVVYQNMVEVSSVPYAGKNASSYWNQDQGAALQHVSFALFTQSIALAVRDIQHGFSASQGQAQKTFAFRQAGVKTYQRGTLLAADCDRTSIRTLRGWIRSVPEKSTTASCAGPQSFQSQR